MSGQFFQMVDVKAKFKLVRPRGPRKIAVPVQVQPRTQSYTLVGTAFDYLVRFELQRRAPHAVAARWVAEAAPDLIWRTDGEGAVTFLQVPREGSELTSPGSWMDDEALARREADRARKVVERAKADVAAYLSCQTSNVEALAVLAAHAIRLARLDSLPRVRRFDPGFEEVAVEDVDDLLAMLAIVPFDRLVHGTVMILNPNFAKTSQLVGGADADLTAGDMLVDFKVTKSGDMTADNLDQLLGYLLLARHERQLDPNFPAINRLGLYFGRHGFLWVLNATAWTDHPQFPEVEEWFFKWAKEAFAARTRVLLGGDANSR